MRRTSLAKIPHLRSARGFAARAYHRAVGQWLRAGSAVFGAGTAVYVAVASLIGVDALTLVVSAAAIWPFGISLLLVALALAHVLRVAWRRRRDRH